ncbi:MULTISPECIES: S9 family peptidase [Anaerolinea]|uniref:S9 family peptidase n=1 Tax=Anaerolinea TaxID=233189 RepID=UPI00260E74CF|nr:S9 family peptidase [Anaerolinea thermophila]
MAKRLITAEDLYRFQVLSDPQISPDGEHVVFSVQRVDRKNEKKYTNLWVVPTRGGNAFQFTVGDHSDGHPVWSPDGNKIAFLSNRLDKEKPPALFVIPFGGGEARPLGQIEGEIGEILWSPDGRKLLLTVRKTDEEVLQRRKDPDRKSLSTPQRHVERLFYKLDGYGYLPRERWHLWVMDAGTGRAIQLTDHPVWDEVYPAWSPDGQWIAFISNHSPDPDSSPELDDIFIMPARGGEARKLPAPPGNKSSLRFSPDGRFLAYYAQEGVDEGFRNEGLWVVPVDGSQPAVNLTEKYDLHVSSWTINDIGSAATNRPVWSQDGESLIFPIVRHGSSLMMRIRRDGTQLETLIGEGGVFHSHTVDVQGERMAGIYGTFSDPGQIAVYNFRTGNLRTLTRFNREILDRVDLGEIEEVWFKGPDNNDLQGWILKPPGFDPDRKYPSIMEIHGGPLTQYGKLFMHEFYYLASQGFVVYFCNPRGGRGYGEAHAGAIHGNWGDRDYADLMAWADYVSQLPYIDTTRMGVTGGSYGGYMTVWIIGHTQRFKAAVTQRCVSNFISMWGSSDFNWHFQKELNNQPPFEALQYYWERSPISYIGNARTPTLVLHNEMDLRCPIEQGEQVFVALKRLGVETEMVRFPEEFHGLSRNGRTDRRILRLNHIARWFKKYLQES